MIIIINNPVHCTGQKTSIKYIKGRVCIPFSMKYYPLVALKIQ